MPAKQSPQKQTAATRQGRQVPPCAAPSAREPIQGAPGAFAEKRVLIVDNENAIPGLLKYNLGAAGIGTVEVTCDGREALELHRGKRFDLILLNRLPAFAGVEALRELRRRGDRVPVIMHSAWDLERHVEGLDVAGLVRMPLFVDDYMQLVRQALEAPVPTPPATAAKAARTHSETRNQGESSRKAGRKK